MPRPIADIDPKGRLVYIACSGYNRRSPPLGADAPSRNDLQPGPGAPPDDGLTLTSCIEFARVRIAGVLGQ